MGFMMSKVMEENMVKQQKLMQDMQELTVRRQIQMQNAMRERMMAMQIAGARDMCYWFGSFYTLATLGAIMGFRRTRRPAALVPILPLTFILGYQIDMGFGSKMHRIRDEADQIMLNEGSLLQLPHGVPTLEEIEARRLQK